MKEFAGGTFSKWIAVEAFCPLKFKCGAARDGVLTCILQMVTMK
jgi:hypothetical protein